MTAHTSMSVPGNLNDKTIKELRALARIRGLRGYSRLRKHDLVKLLQDSRSADAPGSPKPPMRDQPRIAPETDPPVPASRPEPPAPEPGPRARSINNAPTGPDPRADEAKFSPVPAVPDARQPVHDAGNPGTITSRPVLHAPRLVVLPQKPGILHVYWRLPEDPVPEMRLRIVRIDRGGDSIVSEMTPVTAEGNVYIRVPETAEIMEYRAELGCTREDGYFDLVAPWAATHAPRNGPSTDGDALWWISAEEFHNRFARADRPGISSWTGPSPGTLSESAVAPQARNGGATPEEPAGNSARD